MEFETSNINAFTEFRRILGRHWSRNLCKFGGEKNGNDQLVCCQRARVGEGSTETLKSSVGVNMNMDVDLWFS